MKAAAVYLYFDGECERAFELYKYVFRTELLNVIRYRDVPGIAVPEEYLDRIENTGIRICENVILMGSDMIAPGGGDKKPGDGFSIYLEAESKEEAGRVFEGLSEHGTVTVPLSIAHWGDLFGMCTDRFGVNWKINYNRQLHTTLY